MKTRKRKDAMADSSEHQSHSPPASPSAIWKARLTKELPTLDADIDTTATATKKQLLPAGIKLISSDVRLEEGVCGLVFRLEADADAAAAAAAAAEDATEAAPAVVVDIEVRLDRDETNYPFQPPVLRVLVGGARWLPRSVVVPSADDADGGGRVQLPALGGEVWTPNTSVLDLLAALKEALARGPDGDERETEDGYTPGQVLSTCTFAGIILPCTVRQQGGLVLPRYVGVADDWVLQLEADRGRLEAAVVVRAERMLDVAKLRYRRGESLTVIFKDNSRWDLQMAASGDCVALIQAAMAKLGVQGRKTSTSALQQIERARALVQEGRRLGGAGKEGEGQQQHQPPLTLEHVQRVVDLYREAIECLASVTDDRRQTQEVMAMLHAFLSQPAVQAVLEQAPPPPPLPSTPPSFSSSSGSSSRVGAFMSRLSAVPKGLGMPPRKGPVLPRIDAALHAQEDDDGLAREERNLLRNGLSRLKSLLEVGDGGGSARRRLGSRGSDAVGGLDLSVSGDSAASEEEAGGEAGAQGVDDSVGAVLEDLERTVAEATRAFEKLSSPEKPTEPAAHEEREEEEEGAAGPVSAATALQEEGGGKGKGAGATAEAADEEEIVI